MTRRLLLTYLTITVWALVVLIYPLGSMFASRERAAQISEMDREADVVASLSEDALENGTPPDLATDQLAYVKGRGGRAVVVDASAVSVADSDHLTDGVRLDFSTRPEVSQALAGRDDRVTGIRRSETLGTDLRYVAIPVASGGEVHGAVRITYPTATIDDRIRDVWIRLGLLSAVVLGAVTVVGFLLARSVTRPVRVLQAGAEALAHGHLDRRVALDAGAAPELRSLAGTFNATAERLERLVEGQRAFVADASHQLRSPLTALRLRLETIEAGSEADQARLDAATAEVDRLSRLVDGLLVQARATDARPEARTPPARVDVAALAADRVAHWDHMAAQRGVRLALEAPAPLPVDAINGTLDMVLDNLIDNALAVAPEGSTVTVTVRTGRQPGAAGSGDEVVVHVVDAGPGLPPEQRARAFDRFWRAPGNTRRGSGLGLAIVADLMAANRGRAGLDEAPGGGLDAWVALPPAASGGSLGAAHHPGRVADECRSGTGRDGWPGPHQLAPSTFAGQDLDD